jgi:two-component system, chemotaxis family, protein-glutamate methylesterase/glutaminase
VDPSPSPTSADAVYRDIIVVGGSSGSLLPLVRVLADLEPTLPASILVVQHRMAGTPVPVASLAAKTGLSVRAAEDHAQLERHTVYLAPADRHLLLTAHGMRVVHGPRENLARPSIDVLFRSAAVTFKARVIGIILSGDLYDGAAGLAAIRRCGGYTIVQEPNDASNPDLPRTALETSPNKALPAAEIARHLSELVKQPTVAREQVPHDLALEAHAAAVAMTDPSELSRVGEATHFTCPECQGPLWGMNSTFAHFRCDVGHSFTLEALERGQAQALERALWVAHRILAERARLLEQMVANSSQRGMPSVARDYAARKQELLMHSQSVLAALAAIGGPSDRQPQDTDNRLRDTQKVLLDDQELNGEA